MSQSAKTGAQGTRAAATPNVVVTSGVAAAAAVALAPAAAAAAAAAALAAALAAVPAPAPASVPASALAPAAARAPALDAFANICVATPIRLGCRCGVVAVAAFVVVEVVAAIVGATHVVGRRCYCFCCCCCYCCC